MNNKGFTLVELLTTIIILSLLVLLSSTVITKIVRQSKKELSESQMDLIKVAAEMWGSDNYDILPNSGSCGYIYLEDLKEYGLLEENIFDVKTNKELSDAIRIKVTAIENNQGDINYKYEVDSNNTEGCKYVYSICELMEDSDNSKTLTPGDKYSCEVTQGTNYIFYVLSLEEESVNLIMESNLCEDGTVATEENTCLTSWMNQKDYEIAGGTQWDKYIDNAKYGPVTALNYLYKATKDWDNIPNIVINYEDEGNSYGEIKTIGTLTKVTNYNNISVKVNETEKGYTNLKARMPIYSEISTAGCVNWEDQTCPVWLVDYLENSGYEKYESSTKMSGIYGYWVQTSIDHRVAWTIDYRGHLSDHYVYYGDDYGVRPVITIPRTNLT